MKIKTFIAEDEPHSLERLKEQLRDFPELSVIGEAADGLSAVRLINELRPELLFLDIKMPGASGFEVLEKIPYRPLVIFVTAYDQFAIQAFEENAIDYILKPTPKTRLSKAIQRVTERQEKFSQNDLARLKDILKGKESLRRFLVKLGDEIMIIPEEEVYYFKAENKYIFLYTRDKSYFFDMSLKALEERLDPAKFCRIHKSCIVAIDKIKKIKKWFHSEYMLELKDKPPHKLKVGRSYKAALLERFQYGHGTK